MKSSDAYNKAQKKAVENGDGPLLVISGAGTGKTHVLTGRILHLILEKGVSADQILALTFTEKATQEMVERVSSQLPLGHPEVCIKTFHGFCETVLRERGFEIGLSIDYKLLGEVDAWLFLKQHFLDFKLNYFRSLGNPQKFLNSLQEYFSRLQDEDITPGNYAAQTEKMAAKAKTDGEKETAAKHAELAAAFGAYQRLLLENSCMDFGGLLTTVLRLLETRKSVLADYQKRFQYILVDEFQDTNFAQNKLVTLLAGAHKNLFVVGDDDQSIYKWRGASLTNINYFQKLFPSASRIVLNENYRSTQPILDAAYAVIQKNNPNRLEITENVDKKLRAVNATAGTLPEIHHFAALDLETDFIIKKATTALNQGLNTAILVRTNALALSFVNKLKRTRLPYQHFSGSTLFTKPGVKDCVAILRVLADPQDDLALFYFLSMPMWKIPMESLLAEVHQAKFHSTSLFSRLSCGQATGATTADGTATAHKLLQELIEYSRNHPVSQVLHKFLHDSGYLAATSDEANEKESEKISDIAAFSEKVKEFEEKHKNTRVIDFLNFVQLLEEVGNREYETPPLDPGAIKVLTIHSAKGLEFDAVFIPGLVQSKFPSTNRQDPFEIPRELIPEPLPEGDHHIEEERRLFYVACTRAKKQLTLTHSDFYDGKKQWKPSIFIAEMLQSGKAVLKSAKKRTTGGGAAGQIALQLDGDRPHRTLSLKLPKLSYSQLDTYQTCPLKYQFRYLFNIPTPMPGVVNFGTSIHNTLKEFYEKLQKNPQLTKLPGKDLRALLQKLYEENWVPYGYENRALQEDQKRRGAQLLEKFLEHEKKSFIIPAYLEEKFTLKLGDVTITGRIDRIDKMPDGTYEVIDYKTGENKEKNLSRDLQLSIYAIACRDFLKIPVSKLSLYYLDGLEKVSTTRSEKQLAECSAEIIECAREMASSDYAPTPGYHCSYCDFRLICPVAAPVVR